MNTGSFQRWFQNRHHRRRIGDGTFPDGNSNRLPTPVFIGACNRSNCGWYDQCRLYRCHYEHHCIDSGRSLYRGRSQRSEMDWRLPPMASPEGLIICRSREPGMVLSERYLIYVSRWLPRWPVRPYQRRYGDQPADQPHGFSRVRSFKFFFYRIHQCGEYAIALWNWFLLRWFQRIRPLISAGKRPPKRRTIILPCCDPGTARNGRVWRK